MPGWCRAGDRGGKAGHEEGVKRGCYTRRMSFFGFGKQRSVIGVDIGTSTLKAVELTRGSQVPALTGYALLENQAHLLRPSGAVQSSSVKLSMPQLTELLRIAVGKGGFTARNAICSVPPFVDFTAIIDMPPMSPNELESALNFQARQYIPVPLEEVSLQWLKVGESRDAAGNVHEQVMLNAVPLEYVEHCKQAFAGAGLTLSSLEIEQLALVRGAVGPDQTPTLVVDIGALSMMTMVAERGQLTFAEQADIGGSTVTQALAASLGMNPVRAEQMKRERGLNSDGPGREMAAVALPAVDAMVGEVRKAIYTYESRFQRRVPVERVLLSGAGANLRGIEAQFATALQLPVAKAAPIYRTAYPNELEPLLPELNPALTLAIGLALPAVS